MLTTAMQLHAVHYTYDLWGSEAELQSHATESGESDCKCTASPVCMGLSVYVHTMGLMKKKRAFIIHL